MHSRKSRACLLAQVKKRHRNRLRQCRLRALVATQQELARLTGVDRTTISAIENNRLFLSSPHALVFRDALGCSLDDLYEVADMNRSSGNAESGNGNGG